MRTLLRFLPLAIFAAVWFGLSFVTAGGLEVAAKYLLGLNGRDLLLLASLLGLLGLLAFLAGIRYERRRWRLSNRFIFPGERGY